MNERYLFGRYWKDVIMDSEGRLLPSKRKTRVDSLGDSLDIVRAIFPDAIMHGSVGFAWHFRAGDEIVAQCKQHRGRVYVWFLDADQEFLP